MARRLISRLGVLLALALVASGCTVWGWGYNYNGQADPLTEGTHHQSPVASGSNAIDVVSGDAHGCRINSDRTLWCHGNNSWGQLGTGDTTALSGFIPVGADTDWAALDAGAVHTCGLKVDASLWCWGGYPQHLQALDGSLITPNAPVEVSPGSTWTSVGTGYSSTCAIDTGGALYCWGLNERGEVGDETTEPVEEPLLLDSGPWTSVDVGIGSCGVKADGTLWCWGGFSPPWFEELLPPTQFGSDNDWVTVSTYLLHTCALKTDHTIWCWGFNTEGRAGVDPAVMDWLPSPTQVGSDADWRSVTTGSGHTCATKLDWSLWCWGSNGSGQLGDGTTVDRWAPTLVDDTARWIVIDAGGANTLGISI